MSLRPLAAALVSGQTVPFEWVVAHAPSGDLGPVWRGEARVAGHPDLDAMFRLAQVAGPAAFRAAALAASRAYLAIEAPLWHSPKLAAARAILARTPGRATRTPEGIYRVLKALYNLEWEYPGDTSVESANSLRHAKTLLDVTVRQNVSGWRRMFHKDVLSFAAHVGIVDDVYSPEDRVLSRNVAAAIARAVRLPRLDVMAARAAEIEK